MEKLAFLNVAIGLFTRHALTVLYSKRCQNLSCKSRRWLFGRWWRDRQASALRHRRLSWAPSFSRFAFRFVSS